MKKVMYIPKRLKVGFNNRMDTFTGKLAYIIYYDEHNKLHKEASWEHWRDESIKPWELDNTPIDGLIINKKVGDCDNGWDHRKAYCRIYDPRGFEFEITIDNLLYILECTNYVAGKGFDGKFVYAWSGTDLVLMPLNSPDYKEVKHYTELKSTNNMIKLKDLKVGAVYVTPTGDKYVYMGKHDKYVRGYEWEINGEKHRSMKSSDVPNEIKFDMNYYHFTTPQDFNGGKHFVFMKANAIERCKEGGYVSCFMDMYKTFRPNKFQSCSSEHFERFDELMSLMNSSLSISPYDRSGDKFYLMSLDKFKDVLNKTFDIYSYIDLNSSDDNLKEYTFNVTKEYDSDTLYKCTRYNDVTMLYKDKKVYEHLSVDELFELIKPFYIEEYLKNGLLTDVMYIYKH